MDVTAPFVSDMGLCHRGIQEVRSTVRAAIQKEIGLFVSGDATAQQITHWLCVFADQLRQHAAESIREHFWSWVRDTYTLVPADRPNWEMYQAFFFRWSVGMRDGQDIARCFRDARAIQRSHDAFVRAKRLAERVNQSWRGELSTWDEMIFGVRSYARARDAVNFETLFDPFAVVEATSDRNYFQEFWEYLVLLLTEEEQAGLFRRLQLEYKDDFRLPELVAPHALTRLIR
jgi:hypothetical protein